MKKSIYLIIVLLVTVAGIIGGLFIFKKAGISDFAINKKNDRLASDIACKVGDKNITVTELNAYYAAMKTQVESIYSDKVWDVKISENGTSYGEALKESVIDKIIFIKIVSSKAGEYGVELTPDDNIIVEGYVNSFFESINEETATKYNLTKDIVAGIYKDNILCKKVYDKITLNAAIDANVDNCKQADFIRIKVNKYYIDSNDEKKFLSNEEIEKLRADAVAYRELSDPQAFYTVAKNISVEDEPRITCGSREIESELADKVMALKSGTISEVLETEDSIYVYFCENEYNEEATKTAVTLQTETDRKVYFSSLYAKWKDSTDIQINEEELSKLK